MRKYRTAALLFLLLAVPRRGRADLPVITAGDLIHKVDGALAGAAQAARGFAPGNSRYAPFWSSLQTMRARVGEIAGALGQPGDQFFLLIDQGSSDLGELRVAWARTGAKNGQVAEQLRIASTSYRALRSHFGREGVRQKQGGALSEAERRQLAQLQRSERRLAASLRRLRDEARRRRDAATAAELERFRAEAERVVQASADLASYLNALIAASELRGEWQANVPYIRKTAPPAELAAADQTVQDLYVDADIGQVFTADLGNTAESPSGEGSAPAAKVQVLQPGEEVQDVAVVVEPILSDDDDEAPEPAAEPETAEPAKEKEEATAAEPAPEAPEADAAGEPASEAPEQPEAPGAPAAAPIPPPIG